VALTDFQELKEKWVDLEEWAPPASVESPALPATQEPPDNEEKREMLDSTALPEPLETEETMGSLERRETLVCRADLQELELGERRVTLDKRVCQEPRENVVKMG
jgi:hypothetical protein